MTLTPWSPPTITGPPDEITVGPRTAQVLSGVACGLTNAEIAAGLYVTEDTVKTVVRRLFRRMGARNRAHAIALVAWDQVRVTISGGRS